ncbi:MAG: carbohydrate ABC transporter permease [Clostridia bacterium]|nr:carbohydrate ABC transporter permease [Clostridia bacterium]MBQ7053238.1 carbohydrate ABC transporter permease [Clostridia bacterium]
MKKQRQLQTFTFIVLSLGLVIVAIPFYLTIVSAFKTDMELYSRFFALPQKLNLENFKTIFEKPTFLISFFNSVKITLLGLLGCAILLPMAAYPIARRMRTSKIYSFLYYYMLAGIFVPFLVRMIPVIKLLNNMNLADQNGLLLIYLGGATCEGVFLITGYLATVPTDMEEAAYIDGASTFQVYTQIMYPVMKPIISTVLIKNCLWFWNDYLLPSLLLKLPEERTLVLFQYNFKGEHATQYPLVFACLLVSMLPMMIFYFFMQKQIIGGMMAGAVKG